MKNKELSIIICAYNEAETIATVVSECCRHNPLAEIVVVDDGSTDGTDGILRDLQKRYRFMYGRLPENRGKSWAMVHGVEMSLGDIILFFDADVSQITGRHFRSLLDPMWNDEADMVLGQPRETMIDYRINPFRSLTGERAMFRDDLEPILEDIREIRFGVETFINLYYQAEGKRIQYVLLDGLVHPNTFEKTSAIQATKKYISEGQEIARTYMDNYELILKRIENQMNQAGRRTRQKVSELQSIIDAEIDEWLNSFK